MQVDVVGIVELQLDEAERVVVARVLAEHVVDRLIRVPVHLLRLQLVAVLVEDADVVIGEVGRLLLHLRDQVLLDDRSRDRPERIEANLVDLARQDRRLPVDFADDGNVAGHNHAVLDRLDLRAGDVHQHVAVRCLLHRFDAIEVGLQLRKADLCRNVERIERARADDAVGRNAVALLETLHGGKHIGVERLRIAACLPKITRGDQAPAKLDHVRIAHADLKRFVGRHARPAAARDEVLVDIDRLLHRRHGLRREDRRRRGDRARDVGLRVETLGPLGLLDAGQRLLRKRACGDKEGRRNRKEREQSHRSEVPVFSPDHRRSASAIGRRTCVNGALSIVSAPRRHNALLWRKTRPRHKPEGAGSPTFMANRCRLPAASSGWSAR